MLDVPISAGGDELIYLPGDMLGSLQAGRGYGNIPSMHFVQGWLQGGIENQWKGLGARTVSVFGIQGCFDARSW